MRLAKRMIAKYVLAKECLKIIHVGSVVEIIMFDKLIKFTVFGEPQSKLRAKVRLNRKTGSVYMYTPESTRNYEESFAGQSLANKPETLIVGAIKMGIKVYRSIPKSMSKKDRELALKNELRPIKRPDVDNYFKIVMDSLRGIYWVDDCQVVEYVQGSGKYYSETPRVEVEIYY